MRKSIKLAALAILTMTGTAHADTLPPPRAAYDADVVADIGDNHSTARLNAAGPKLRVTADLSTGPQTVLVDRTISQVYMLMPSLGTAMTIDRKTMGGYDLGMLNTTPVTADGEEAVSGVNTTRYAVKAQAKNGSFDGHIWATPDGAIMQVEGNVISAKMLTPVRIVLSNFHEHPQNPALFVLPSGTRVMSFGLASLLGSSKGYPVPQR